jgi:hypothetical protein
MTVSLLSPGGYPKPPYSSFAGKPATTGDNKVWTQNFSVLGPGGYPKALYGSFGGRVPSPVGTSSHTVLFIANMGRLMGNR